MIAELFYPKKLKEVIADLRAKDDLNELALKEIKRKIYIELIISLIIILMFIMDGNILFSLLVFTFTLLIWKYEMYGYYRDFLEPYLKGEKVSGIIIKINNNPYFGTSIKCQDNKGNLYKLTPVRYKRYTKSYSLKKGQEILFFCKGSDETSMIDLKPINQKFCLSNAKI